MRLVILFLITFFAVESLAATRYPFARVEQRNQFEQLLKELRCLVCQNQDLADSNASLAKDLRFEVYTRVKNGQSNAQITHYLTERYGDFILFKPPFKWVTLVLWLGPLLFLAAGLGIFWHFCLRQK